MKGAHSHGLQLSVILLLILSFCLPAFAQVQPSATQTELAEQGKSLKTDFLSPSAGLYTNIADVLRPPTNARVLDNLEQLKTGIWTSHGIGYTQAGTYTSSNPVLVMTADGTGNILVQDGLQFGSYATATNTSTNTTGTLAPTNATPRPDISPGVNTPGAFVYCHGDTDISRPQVLVPPATTWFDLTSGWNSFTLAAAYHGPSFSQAFQSRQAYAGFFNATTTVLISKYGLEGNFTTSSPQQATDAGAITIDNKYGNIVGIHTFRLGNSNQSTVLLIGCQHGLCMITGTDATSFALEQVSVDYGVLNNNCWADVGDSCYVLGTNGVHKIHFTDTGASLVTDTVSFPINDLIQRINVNATTACWSVHHPTTAEVFWWIPVDSETVPTHALVMNYNSSANPSQTNPVMWSTRSGVTMAAGCNSQGNIYATDGANGTINLHYNGDTYNGTNFTWEYDSAFIGGNSPKQNSSLKTFNILTEGAAQAFTATPYYLTQMADSSYNLIPAQATSVSAPAVSTTPAHGTWKTSSTTSTTDKFIDVGVLGSGRYWALDLTGTGQGIDLIGVQTVLTVGGWHQ